MPEDALTLFPAVLFWSRLEQTSHMQIRQRYILQIYEVRREAYETVRDSFRPCTASGGENKRQREWVREKTREKIREENGVWYENIRWDVKTVNSGAFVLSPHSPPLSRTRKSTGLMVSFIISYTLAVLFLWESGQKVNLFPPSLLFLSLSVLQTAFLSLSLSLSISLFRPLSDVYQPKNAPRNLYVEVFHVSPVYSHFSFQRLIINSCV